MWRKPNRRKKLDKRDKHHLLPKSRGGKNHPSNLLLIDKHKHELWHQLWGTRSLEEVLNLLTRMARMKGYRYDRKVLPALQPKSANDGNKGLHESRLWQTA